MFNFKKSNHDKKISRGIVLVLSFGIAALMFFSGCGVGLFDDNSGISGGYNQNNGGYDQNNGDGYFQNGEVQTQSADGENAPNDSGIYGTWIPINAKEDDMKLVIDSDGKIITYDGSDSIAFDYTVISETCVSYTEEDILYGTITFIFEYVDGRLVGYSEDIDYTEGIIGGDQYIILYKEGDTRNHTEIDDDMFGVWENVTGADNHSLVIAVNDTIKMIDSYEITLNYTRDSNTSISFKAVDGNEIFTLKYENDTLIRYKDGELDGYTYKRVEN